MANKIDGGAVAAIAIGTVFIWGGLKGYSPLIALKNLIKGVNPNTGQTTALLSNDSSTSGNGTSTPITGGIGIPNLGTTLPPESTMIQYFGPLGDASYETWVPFAGKTVQVNKALANNVQGIGNALANAGFTSYIRTVGGFRTSVGASGSPIPYSMHQFGAAIDINEDGGPNGNWNTMTLPAQMVSIFASAGWFCGQNWSGASRDGGHFQYSGGS